MYLGGPTGFSVPSSEPALDFFPMPTEACEDTETDLDRAFPLDEDEELPLLPPSSREEKDSLLFKER